MNNIHGLSDSDFAAFEADMLAVKEPSFNEWQEAQDRAIARSWETVSHWTLKNDEKGWTYHVFMSAGLVVDCYLIVSTAKGHKVVRDDLSIVIGERITAKDMKKRGYRRAKGCGAGYNTVSKEFDPMHFTNLHFKSL